MNNPHFLIMQGRITKVLNMKPKDFLNMLEEAAGTKMYVDKSKQALTTLARKERKLDEIEDVRVHPPLVPLRISWARRALLRAVRARGPQVCHTWKNSLVLAM